MHGVTGAFRPSARQFSSVLFIDYGSADTLGYRGPVFFLLLFMYTSCYVFMRNLVWNESEDSMTRRRLLLWPAQVYCCMTITRGAGNMLTVEALIPARCSFPPQTCFPSPTLPKRRSMCPAVLCGLLNRLHWQWPSFENYGSEVRRWWTSNISPQIKTSGLLFMDKFWDRRL